LQVTFLVQDALTLKDWPERFDSVIDSGPRLTDDLEELALAVALHVQGDDASGAGATGGVVGELQPCADAGELDVEEVRVHRREDTAAEGRVRSQTTSKMTVRRTATASDEG
jgi:hypothetical protein